MDKTVIINQVERLKTYAKQHATRQEKAQIDEIVEIIKDELKSSKKVRNELEIYVDGSYDFEHKICGSGIVVLKDGTVIRRKQRAYTSKKKSEYQNNAGEILSAMMAIDYAIGFKAKKLKLYYDCESIEKWSQITDFRKLKSIRMEYYKKIILAQKNNIDIQFIKVTAHSNNTYNNMADRLAKDAIQIKLKTLKKEATKNETS